VVGYAGSNGQVTNELITVIQLQGTSEAQTSL
jgi:hypothetical protein